MAEKRFVYVLRSLSDEPAFYVGITSEVTGRLEDRNAGRCPYTSRRRPWQLHVVMECAQGSTALRFERYLKSGSGRAFAKRHFEG
jgi:predicted GIY-YIG superfamily endonuclease